MGHDKNKSHYKIGDTTEGGSIIGSILGANHDVIVFLTAEYKLRWEVTDDYKNPAMSEQVALVDRVRNRIDACIYLTKAKKRLVGFCGKQLYLALRKPEDKHSGERLKRSLRDIDEEIMIHLRIYQIIASISLSAILCLIFYGLQLYSRSEIYPPLMAGLLGVVLSIMFSFTRVRISNQATAMRQIFDAVVRILYGCLCGLVAFILMKAQIFGSIFVDKEYGLQAICIVAGFCERLIPSVLDRVAKKEEDGDE